MYRSNFLNTVKSSLMCGRYALNRALAQLMANINARRIVTNDAVWHPSNNIAPGATAPIVHDQEIHMLNWGIMVDGRPRFNARSETVVEKYRSDILQRRCVIPADGYFEWNQQKQPFFFQRNEGGLLFLAGFYTNKGEFVILTREPSMEVRSVHHRMPIILDLSQISHWEGDDWASVINYVPPVLKFFRVARSSLSSGYSGSKCIQPIQADKLSQRTLDDLLGRKTPSTKV